MTSCIHDGVAWHLLIALVVAQTARSLVRRCGQFVHVPSLLLWCGHYIRLGRAGRILARPLAVVVSYLCRCPHRGWACRVVGKGKGGFVQCGRAALMVMLNETRWRVLCQSREETSESVAYVLSPRAVARAALPARSTSPRTFDRANALVLS